MSGSPGGRVPPALGNPCAGRPRAPLTAACAKRKTALRHKRRAAHLTRATHLFLALRLHHILSSLILPILILPLAPPSLQQREKPHRDADGVGIEPGSSSSPARCTRCPLNPFSAEQFGYLSLRQSHFRRRVITYFFNVAGQFTMTSRCVLPPCSTGLGSRNRPSLATS